MPGYGIPWLLIASVALVSVLFLFLVVGMALKARHHPIVSGAGYSNDAWGIKVANVEIKHVDIENR